MKPPLRPTVILMILPLLLVGCGRPAQPATPVATSPRPAVIAAERSAPIAVARLDGDTLRFWCPDREACIEDIRLGKQIGAHPHARLGRLTYWDASHMLGELTLAEGFTDPQFFLLNPQTGALTFFVLPEDVDDELSYRVVAGRIIFFEVNSRRPNRVYLSQPDFSFSPLDLTHPVDSLIVGANSTAGHPVIALYREPVVDAGRLSIDVSLIDPLAGTHSALRLGLPGLALRPGPRQSLQAGKNYLVSIQGVSRDLAQVYCLFLQGDTPDILRLGSFHTGKEKESVSSETPALPGSITGYAQYHETLYSGRLPSQAGPGGTASLIDMNGPASLLDFEAYPFLNRPKLLPRPFGDSFLLDTGDQIVLLSPAGEVIEQYFLPNEWRNLPYQVVSYEP